MRRLLKLLNSRLAVVIVLILVQLYLLFLAVYRSMVVLEILPYERLFALVLVLFVIGRKEDPSYKIAWSVLILSVPVLGGFLYLLCAGRKMPRKLRLGTTQADERMKSLLRQDMKLKTSLQEEGDIYLPMFENARRNSSLPYVRNTRGTYYRDGRLMFEAMLEDLKNAEHFIFMEFFILSEGEMWNSILAVLQEKVKQGVQVRLVYDDVGSVLSVPYHYDRKLNAMGIETYRFNPLRAAMAIQMNNRDHRKILVVDGKTAYTGGINLADEYIHGIEKYGYWRDGGIRMEGDAVWPMTVMFLGMFTYLKKDSTGIEYQRYRCPDHSVSGSGVYQPFSDTPTDDADTGLNVHLNLILNARKYVYINTPYLILPSAMVKALTLAAGNGVDVRILVPHIPDKKITFQMTRGNYAELVRAGVRIYEFTPGFNHSKAVVVDDVIGTVGTVNTDYRSYYLHFENGVLFEDEKVAVEVRRDFEDALRVSREVHPEDCAKRSRVMGLLQAVLNLLAPLF